MNLKTNHGLGWLRWVNVDSSLAANVPFWRITWRMGEASHVWDQRVHRKSLYLPLNLVVNLRLLKMKKVFFFLKYCPSKMEIKLNVSLSPLNFPSSNNPHKQEQVPPFTQPQPLGHPFTLSPTYFPALFSFLVPQQVWPILLPLPLSLSSIWEAVPPAAQATISSQQDNCSYFTHLPAATLAPSSVFSEQPEWTL